MAESNRAEGTESAPTDPPMFITTSTRSLTHSCGAGVRPEDQAAIDASVFYLLSSAHTSSRNGLSIDAYSCVECK